MKAYEELKSDLRDAELLSSAAAVIQWDEQTFMPPKGAEHRAAQLGLLAGIAHERKTSPRIGERLSELETADLGPVDSDLAVNVREARRTYNRAICLPKRLVEELTRTASLGQQAWVKARKEADFELFLPWLKQMIALKREEASAVGYGAGVPYDALLDDYEPGASTAQVQAVFVDLRTRLVPLIRAIVDSGRQPDVSVLERHYPVGAQAVLSEGAAKAIGFDFDAGRIDRSAHPFCSGIGPGDCRLTTRYQDHFFSSAFFGVLHEAGHGIYEQGLPGESFGLPMGQTTSLGIHESQSRMWENLVGRSRSFWNYMFPSAQQAFPASLKDVSVEDFYRAINVVRPSLIRVEADEVTYNIHIMIRFELEQQLMDGSLAPADVPAAWNALMERDLGIVPGSASEGCLQDIHWSAGLMGYFPTYALGNMYAAQFFEAAERELGPLAPLFARGEFKPLRDWLRRNIHQHGKRYRAPELVQKVTGSPLSAEPLVRQLQAKYAELYQL